MQFYFRTGIRSERVTKRFDLKNYLFTNLDISSIFCRKKRLTFTTEHILVYKCIKLCSMWGDGCVVRFK